MAHDFDIVVAGGGPAGLIFSERALSSGLDVNLLEEHLEIGSPLHCSGLVSIQGLKRIGIELPSECIENKIYGANIFSPKGILFKIESAKPLAYALDRIKFDKYLEKRAVEKGLEISFGTEAVHLIKKNTNIFGVTDNHGNDIYSDMTVSAEGVSGHLVTEAGLQPIKKSGLIPAIQFELSDVNIDRRKVQIFLGRKYSTFFAWMIPTGKDGARVGLASNDKNNYEKLNIFVKEKLKNAVRRSVLSGILTVSGPIRKAYANGFLAIGDVCGQTKPTTGGGIITGGICAKIAAEAAIESIERGDVKHSFLRKNYEKKWRRILGKEFSTMLLTRTVFNSLSDKTLDKIFESIVKSNFSSDFAELHDMDFHGDAIKRILKKIIKGRAIFLIINDLMRDFVQGKY